jgi:bifunctional DNA-binding transcriptional regulator/antitoxin component of YhaV-PrlF toxin-antitoxin module
MAAFPKLGYVPTSPKMEPASPPVDLYGESHHGWGGEGKVEPHQTCNFCAHLANRLETKIAGMQRAGRHIPYGLRRDARLAREDSLSHTTRDDKRVLICPRLRAHRCDVCGDHGHTRSRCAPCGYCGEVGHIHNECPKELADQAVKGDTVVLTGLSPHMRDHIAHFLETFGVSLHYEKDQTWKAGCDKVVFETVEIDGEGMWDIIHVRDCGEPKPEEHCI